MELQNITRNMGVVFLREKHTLWFALMLPVNYYTSRQWQQNSYEGKTWFIRNMIPNQRGRLTSCTSRFMCVGYSVFLINIHLFPLEDSIPELVAIKSQLSAAEEEVVRMKERETSLQQQHKQLCSENSELGLDLVAAKREIETLKIKNVTLQREKHSLAEQLTQTEDEVQRLNSEMFSLQQNCATLQQSSSHCSSLEQEKQGLSEALRDQAHESAKVQWQLQQQLTLKGEALDGEVKKHTETRAALRNTQLALDQMREENHRLRQSQGSAEIEDHWRISRNEVVINQGVVLGSGAWGNVAEGQFRGKKVAVKCLHEQIVASQTLDRVHREIRTMASIRHPNIVLFVAAVLDTNGQPLIISELLDTSLRRAYETHQLSGTVTKLEILHGVACALNYLHKLHQPIIHRDVSSANVLLKAASNDKWTPKLSDFGSANLAQSSQTLGEGAIIYSAPETFPDCSNSLSQPHTTKIDVYSFGVLIGELLTEQLPNPKSLPSTLETVEAKWPLLHTLMVNCTKRNLLHRPDMDTVIAEISATLFDGTS